MLKPKRVDQILTATQIYRDNVKKQKEREARELINTSWKMLQAGQMNALQYQQIVRKNQPIQINHYR